MQEDFKHLCQKLSHRILKKKERGNTVYTEATGIKIKKYVDSFFTKFKVYDRSKDTDKIDK